MIIDVASRQVYRELNKVFALLGPYVDFLTCVNDVADDNIGNTGNVGGNRFAPLAAIQPPSVDVAPVAAPSPSHPPHPPLSVLLTMS